MSTACDCSGYSDRCYFSQELYEKTGHGGHCLDCTANRDGPNCQRCRDNYYEIEGGMCIACHCNEQGEWCGGGRAACVRLGYVRLFPSCSLGFLNVDRMPRLLHTRLKIYIYNVTIATELFIVSFED